MKSNLFLGVLEFSKYENSDGIKLEIVGNLRNFYSFQSALDDEFSNMYEYLGYIQYQGGEHYLYEMTHNELESEIYNYIEKLKTPDLVMLFDDIDEATKDFIMDIEDWDDFRSSLFKTDEIKDIIKRIKQDFLDLVPAYNPYIENNNDIKFD